mmetsp:Transcript_48966/g.140739  ORF Transcript_48966/g.140739 Transcript_48966/m.140739 type:complete len:203 (-) Transcript_48966:809-1417(-)
MACRFRRYRAAGGADPETGGPIHLPRGGRDGSGCALRAASGWPTGGRQAAAQNRRSRRGELRRQPECLRCRPLEGARRIAGRRSFEGRGCGGAPLLRRRPVGGVRQPATEGLCRRRGAGHRGASTSRCCSAAQQQGRLARSGLFAAATRKRGRRVCSFGALWRCWRRCFSGRRSRSAAVDPRGHDEGHGGVLAPGRQDTTKG